MKKCNKSEHDGIEYEKVRETGEKSRKKVRGEKRRKREPERERGENDGDKKERNTYEKQDPYKFRKPSIVT